MKAMTRALVSFVKSYLPNPASLAIILTIIVFLAGVIATPFGIVELANFYGNGLYGNLTFVMQMIMILFAGYALAISSSVNKLLRTIAAIPKTRSGALAFVFTVSMVCGYINWGFGLVASALIAKEVAARNIGKKTDFAIMVAAAYAACQIPALSSAVVLISATPGHFLEGVMGVMPIGETLFAPFNVIMTIAYWLALLIVLMFINPKESDSIELDPAVIEAERKAAIELKEAEMNKVLSPAEKIDNFLPLSFFVAALMLIFVGRYFANFGFMNLSTNVVITIFLALGLLAHKNPISYVRAVNEAIKTCGGVAFLFPLYWGLMGLMRDSGITSTVTGWFMAISTANTLPLFTFWSASLINTFIPSGGGQWAIQGPIVMQAAVNLGADLSRTAMAVTWGDLSTNLIQPFWAIPVLAVVKKDVRDIMGYCFMMCLAAMIVLSIGFVIL